MVGVIPSYRVKPAKHDEYSLFLTYANQRNLTRDQTGESDQPKGGG